jgi:hypothetical protein
MGLGSVIRKNLFRIPDTGVIKAMDPGSGSATLDLSIYSGSRGPKGTGSRRIRNTGFIYLSFQQFTVY